MEQQLKRLWEQAFDSGTSYTNLFFSYLYSDKNVRYKKKDGKIVSAAYTLPYDMEFFGEKLPASYMCGVATDIDYRGKGMVSDVIKKSFKKLYGESKVFCGLIPINNGLYNFYERFGFSTVYKCVKSKFKKTGDSRLELKTLTEYDFCSKIYNEKIAAHDFSYFMPPGHFDFLSNESNMFGEAPLSIYKEGVFSGYMFFTKADGENLIREIVTDGVTVSDAVNALCRDQNIDAVTVYTPSFYGFEGEEFNIGMLRIINVRKALEVFYRKENNPVTFKIKDDIIPENTGLFTVCRGVVAENNTDEKPMYSLSVTELLEFFRESSSPFYPYINMLLN